MFVDIDTENAHVIKEYSERTIVVAVTDQERTGPVMEAATWGAYEIMHRPLKKERIERLLEELHGLGQEMDHAVVISKDTIAPAATCVIVGRSSLVMSLCEKVARIAQVEVPVLITGETGTGQGACRRGHCAALVPLRQTLRRHQFRRRARYPARIGALRV